jgi:hypothetical protein
MKHEKKNKSGNKRGLHRKGSKNLIKLNGDLVNQHGVVFTEAEKKALEYKVNSAMAKRRRILKDKNSAVRTILGVPQDYTVGQDFDSNDFMMSKKSKSLNKFKTRQAYEIYMNNLERITKKDYIDKKLQTYKNNFETAIKKTFGSDGNKAIKQLQKMSLSDFTNLVNSEMYARIQYIYSKEEYQVSLEVLNTILGVE